MGPVRGIGLALITALFPKAAFAEVCAQFRPDWDGEAVTIWWEFAYLFASFPTLVLVMVTAFVVRTRSQWGGLATTVAWTIWVTVIISNGNDVMAAGRAEGCVGSPALFIALVAAICAWIVVRTLPRPKDGTSNGD